jgi:hypothetical protein
MKMEVSAFADTTKQIIKPGINCTRLLREAVFVALPRKVVNHVAARGRTNTAALQLGAY